MLDRNYVEEDVRYTLDGRMIHFKFAPAKMNPIGIARRIMSKRCQKPEVFTEFLMMNIDNYVTSALIQQNLLTSKPDKEVKIAFKKQVQEASLLIKTNLRKILKDLLFYSGDNPDLEYLTKEQKERLESHQSRAHDSAVFNLRMARSITGLVNSEGFNAVLNDYRTVQEVLKDPRRFNELEKLCSRQLKRFLTDKKIRYMDEESQRQEGLLAIWACASKYEARDFARFSTLANVALNNKYKNLLRFFTSHKRRVQKYTSPAGSATDPKESFLARQIDKLTTANWRRVQRIQLSDQALEEAEYDPFFTLPVIGDYGESTDPEKEWVVISENGTEIIDENNFPYLNQTKIENVRPVELRQRKRHKVQEEFTEKWNAGEVYTDNNGILRARNPSPLMQELWDDERPDLRYKDFSRGTYRDSPPQRKARNLEQLDILVKFGENLTFEQMVEALERGRYFVEFGKGDEDWTKAKEELIETVNTEYPGALLDDYPFRLLRTNIANKTIPKKVKEKYVKCFILAESAAGRELYAETRELVPKEKDKLPF